MREPDGVEWTHHGFTWSGPSFAERSLLDVMFEPLRLVLTNLFWFTRVLTQHLMGLLGFLVLGLVLASWLYQDLGRIIVVGAVLLLPVLQISAFAIVGLAILAAPWFAVNEIMRRRSRTTLTVTPDTVHIQITDRADRTLRFDDLDIWDLTASQLALGRADSVHHVPVHPVAAAWLLKRIDERVSQTEPEQPPPASLQALRQKH